MNDCQEWYQLCLRLIGIIAFLIIVLLVVIIVSYNYSLKLKRGQIKLKKEIQEVERVNGKEKRDIKELQEKLKKVEELQSNLLALQSKDKEKLIIYEKK